MSNTCFNCGTRLGRLELNEDGTACAICDKPVVISPMAGKIGAILSTIADLCACHDRLQDNGSALDALVAQEILTCAKQLVELHNLESEWYRGR